MRTKIYGLTKENCVTLSNHFNNDASNLGLLLWNRGKVKTLESGVLRAKKIIKFAKS